MDKEKPGPLIIHPAEYKLFCHFLEQTTGIVLNDNKSYLVGSRLGRILVKYGITSIYGLVDSLKKGVPKLQEEVINAMTTHETHWFRDGYPFTILTTEILPKLKKTGLTMPIKIWCSGCSSGQEAYGISIVISEYLSKHLGSFPHGFQIMASDIAENMLEQGRQAEYDLYDIKKEISLERTTQFFEPLVNNKMRLKNRERDRVTFRNINLLNSYVLLGKFHIIFCRNVLIYFSTEVRKNIIKKLSVSLYPGGYLFLGASESIGTNMTEFNMIQGNPGIVYIKKP